mmetsp:Transcript_9791/g.16264  ORF Transcript_9791/g.16264 Transcript_9791/m.16264 type:complete len:196 (-) Transcript_9791:3688-4275(-)
MLSVSWMHALGSLLSLQVLLSAWVSAVAALSQESPLHKVLHQDLFTHHDLSSRYTALMSRSHFHHALHSNATAPILFLGCGPVLPEPHPQASIRDSGHKDSDEARESGTLGMEHHLRKVLGPGRVHVASIDHKLQEACVAFQATPEDVLTLALPLGGAARDREGCIHTHAQAHAHAHLHCQQHAPCLQFLTTYLD